jgi:hypothetical protein
MPLVVLTAAHDRELDLFQGLPPEIHRRWRRLMRVMQAELAALSSDRAHVLAMPSEYRWQAGACSAPDAAPGPNPVARRVARSGRRRAGEADTGPEPSVPRAARASSPRLASVRVVWMVCRTVDRHPSPQTPPADAVVAARRGRR